MSNPGTTNLVAWWSLDETSGTRADSHGSNDLTDNNTVLSGTGKQGNAADFEWSGNGEHLDILDNAEISMGDTEWAIGCWVNFETLPNGVGNTSHAMMMAKDNTGTLWKREYTLYLSSAQNWTFSIGNGGTGVRGSVAVASGASTGVWYFVVGRHDPVANTVGISVDGGAFTTAATTGPGIDSDGRLYLGRYGTAGAFFWLDGLLDEAFIYRKALTDAQVAWLYNSGNGRAYSDLTAGAASVPLMLLMSGQAR